jgi:hypothetical protein
VEAIGVAARSMSQQSHIRLSEEHYARVVVEAIAGRGNERITEWQVGRTAATGRGGRVGLGLVGERGIAPSGSNPRVRAGSRVPLPPCDPLPSAKLFQPVANHAATT